MNYRVKSFLSSRCITFAGLDCQVSITSPFLVDVTALCNGNYLVSLIPAPFLTHPMTTKAPGLFS
jgi:hypothetical protein